MNLALADLTPTSPGAYIDVPGSELPADLWLAAVKEQLSDPDFAVYRGWLTKLQSSFGAEAFPGEVVAVSGHALTSLRDEPDPPGKYAELRRDRDVRDTDAGLSWYLVRAATRREARAEAALVEAGFAVYLPRLTHWRRRGPEKQRIERSLFGGYLFVGLKANQALMGVEAIDAVHAVVRFTRAEFPVPLNFSLISDLLDDEMAGDHDKTRSHPEVLPGAPVSIRRGKFQAFPAEFVKLRENERVEVMLTCFGRATPLVLKRDDITELCGDDG